MNWITKHIVMLIGYALLGWFIGAWHHERSARIEVEKQLAERGQISIIETDSVWICWSEREGWYMANYPPDQMSVHPLVAGKCFMSLKLDLPNIDSYYFKEDSL